MIHSGKRYSGEWFSGELVFEEMLHNQIASQNKILRMFLNVRSWTRTTDVRELARIKMFDEKV